MDITCLMTTVANTSGVERIFGFLPPRGRTLAAGAEFSEIGSVVDWIQNRGGLAPAPEKQVAALKRAMLEGDLEIKNGMATVLYDPTATETKILSLDNSVLADTDPCWVA